MIDGVDIQFVHVRSRYPNAMPLIMTHGWPGSIFELVKVIGPLTDPPAYGGRAEDAFDLVLPLMPGYGFSGRPQVTGWNPDHIARAWAELMRRLGYKRYVSQGGDWGAVISDVMARQAPAGLLGIHVNMPATVPPDVAKVLASGGPAPAGLSPEEKVAFEGMDALYKKGSGYALMMVTRPQTLGYKHRSLFCAALLGKQRQQLHRRRHLHPCCCHGLSRRNLSCAAKLDGAQLSQTHLFPRGR